MRRLFENYAEVEKEYYLKTHIFPIMHAIVIRRTMYEANPWVAMSLYKAFLASKSLTTPEHAAYVCPPHHPALAHVVRGRDEEIDGR